MCIRDRVASDGKLIGIISERDIVRVCAGAESNPLETLVKAAMSTNLEVASLKYTIDMALARMTDRRIRHLPVVEGEKLVGIVSIGDLVKKQIDNAVSYTHLDVYKRQAPYGCEN